MDESDGFGYSDEEYEREDDVPFRPGVSAPPVRPLAQLIGLHLQRARNTRRLSQATFAERLGMSQQRLSRLERGAIQPTTGLIERVFAALDLQVRVEIEPLGVGFDAEIDRYTDLTVAERTVEVADFLYLLDKLGELPYTIGGRLGAFLQGAPLRVVTLDLVIVEADLAQYAKWFARTFCQRWSEQWSDWGYGSTDPRDAGPMRWHVGMVELRMEVRTEAPAAVAVRVDERDLAVVPLPEIEIGHPDVGRIMQRMRARAASRVPG
jgi:transcriptional regulator with XRE-family HTH domain